MGLCQSSNNSAHHGSVRAGAVLVQTPQRQPGRPTRFAQIRRVFWAVGAIISSTNKLIMIIYHILNRISCYDFSVYSVPYAWPSSFYKATVYDFVY